MLWESERIVELNHIFYSKNFIMLSVIDKMPVAGDVDNKAGV